VNQGWINKEAFGEETDGSSTVGETNKGDAAVFPSHVCKIVLGKCSGRFSDPTGMY